jgi:ABC-type iron transport system FetAB ATPase subunit
MLMRPAHAGWRQRELSGLRFSPRFARDQEARRLHDAAVQFYEDLTIEENLDFIAKLYEIPQRKAAVEKSLERLGMTERRHSSPARFPAAGNSGWRLSACLIHEPQLLLLDEPTAGVDPKARRDFWEEIHQLAAGRPDRADYHALHGRGGTLPSARLHRLRQSAGPRHGRTKS